MLASQKCYRKGELYYEEANGSRDIIDKIDPEVLIEYWSYIPSLKYPLLEKIRKSGHDICVTFWTLFQQGKPPVKFIRSYAAIFRMFEK